MKNRKFFRMRRDFVKNGRAQRWLAVGGPTSPEFAIVCTDQFSRQRLKLALETAFTIHELINAVNKYFNEQLRRS